ncbi:MAG: hypothetical protein A2538_00605 [Candidatus Magasanikbacteria bacterium RIFOXYD2_FULL_41_14]|uniref:Integrase n=1 Tax=Candidatus Magasanikbacteria bacterium RIFOXYD2_FULL_41_14 TaxID=1798709 RepID=A0A1F6PC12_9BACT|nr:MAG: hypothetical protein A2538_00605 [Candidatus Magasanikbacteria bacterium RIFOXYD2_FULL_41_14]
MDQNTYYPSQDPMVKLRQEMKLRNFSQKTIKSYLNYTIRFINWSNRPIREVTGNDIRMFLEFLVDNKSSASTVNTAYSALQFYFGNVLGRNFFINIPRAKKSRYLPVVLSKQEVARLLAALTNPKHHCIVSLLYGAGLRVSEVVRIKMCDIDFDRMLLRVFQGKGKKDRLTLLPKSLHEILRKQNNVKKPTDYLFTHEHGVGRLTERTVQKVVSEASKRAGITKSVHPHILRHSFATHLLESGTDIRYIQELLGHANLQTTQIYTHVASNNLGEIKSPLDNFAVRAII